MSKRVLFNGAVLVRPGAATKIDASQFQDAVLTGIGIVGLIGAADGGQPRTVQVFSTPQAVKSFYRSGDLVEAANLVKAPSNDPLIQAGASAIVCYKTNNSAAASLTKSGTFVYTSKDYGLHTNNIQLALSNPLAGSDRVLTISTIDEFGLPVTETSPSLGTAGKFTIQYVGAGSGCTMTISATQLTTTVTGGPGGEALTLNFSDYPNLAALLRYIDGLAAYTATSLITNDTSFDPSYLDAVTTVDIRTALTTVYARNFDQYDWIIKNSQIITATLTKGQTGPIATFTATALAGGTKGSSSNTDWTNGFTGLGGVRCTQVVPLASADGSGSDTYTIASIAAGLASHAKFYSSTAGRSERQGWIGVSMTKTNLIALANTTNSEHICLVGQKVKVQRASDSALVYMPEWASACMLAGLRAGAPLGEPITHKFLAVYGVSEDASWSHNNDADVIDLDLNGVMVIAEKVGSGFYLDKGITTYTKSENDAFMEETIVQGWKQVSYGLRQALEARYTGRPGTLAQVNTVDGTVSSYMEKQRDAGAITDSFQNGQTIKAYRGITKSLNGDVLSVGCTFSPTPGINFILNTLVIVPAVVSSQ